MHNIQEIHFVGRIYFFIRIDTMLSHIYSDVTTIAIIYLTTLLHNMFLIIDISLPLFFCILTLVKRIHRKG